MGKGEDLNEEFFAVNDERFLTQQKPSLLICWDFVSKPREPLRCLRCTDTGGTRPLLLQHRTISFKLLAKSVNCLQGAHLVPKCARKRLLSLYYTLCFCLKQYNFNLLIYSQPPVICHFTNWYVGFQLWSVLTVYDICCIFHELQHSLARLQHGYYDVTIVMGM